VIDKNENKEEFYEIEKESSADKEGIEFLVEKYGDKILQIFHKYNLTFGSSINGMENVNLLLLILKKMVVQLFNLEEGELSTEIKELFSLISSDPTLQSLIHIGDTVLNNNEDDEDDIDDDELSEEESINENEDDILE
jgi:hypothetical protein